MRLKKEHKALQKVTSEKKKEIDELRSQTRSSENMQEWQEVIEKRIERLEDR